MLDSRKATGFYRGDAARLVSEAARLPAEPAQAPDTEPIPEPAPPPAVVAIGAPAVVLDDPQRPPLSPQPPTNQNLRAERPRAQDLEDEEDGQAPWPVARVVAWIILAPWYVAIAAASFGLDILFVKDLIGF